MTKLSYHCDRFFNIMQYCYALYSKTNTQFKSIKMHLQIRSNISENFDGSQPVTANSLKQSLGLIHN